MGEKYIRVRMPDGDWDIPARIVADDMAKYYAEHDRDTTYDEEFNYAMSDNYELTDWLTYSMFWDDVKEHAVHIKPLAIDYDMEWLSAGKEVVEK